MSKTGHNHVVAERLDVCADHLPCAGNALPALRLPFLRGRDSGLASARIVEGGIATEARPLPDVRDSI